MMKFTSRWNATMSEKKNVLVVFRVSFDRNDDDKTFERSANQFFSPRF